MQANHKVSVAWQIVFTFLPIVNFWAFYRIRKLRKYVLYVIVPSIVLSIVIGFYSAVSGAIRQTDSLDFADYLLSSETQLTYIILTYGLSFAMQAFTIYLVIIWSRQHNRRVDASTGQAPA